MRSLISIVLMLLFVADAMGIKTTILGKSKGHAGYQIAAFSPSDYISGKRELLALVTIGDKDDFRLEFDISTTRQIQIDLLHMQAVMYAEPGKEYKIVYEDVERNEAKRLDKTEVSLVFEGLPGDDLNILLAKFDKDYTAFIKEHFYDFAVGDFKGNPEFSGKMKDKTKVDLYSGVGESDSLKRVTVSNFSDVVVRFFENVQATYSSGYENAFFHDYVRYSLSEIELVAGLNKKLYYKDYFMSQEVLYHNPAYMRVFRMFYRNLFEDQTRNRQEAILKNINTLQDGLKLIDVFAGDSIMLSSEVRAVAVIQALKDNIYNRAYSRAGIEQTLSSIEKDCPQSEIQKMSRSVQEELKKNRSGWEQDNFVLLDASNDKWNLRDVNGLPVYIIFFASWSSASVKEMLVLEKLQETYGKDIHIVGICMDENVDSFRKYLREHPKQNFTMLYGYGDILLKEKFNLKALPYAVLLDADQKVVQDYTSLPSQGIQTTFAKIQAQAKSGGQGPGTWKGRE